MTAGQHSFAQDIQTLFESGSLGELTDRQLLERFTIHEAETSELAFAVLLKRHGPMVLRTCTAILRDRHEAEDAAQATFLVLASKASSLWVRDSLGPWLFSVARCVASCARSTRFAAVPTSRKLPGQQSGPQKTLLGMKSMRLSTRK